MTIYEFIASRDECHKLTFQRFNAVSLVNAYSLMESLGDRAAEVRMHQSRFSEFVCNAFDDKTENSIYERTVRSMKFMNADIVIDNTLDPSIVVVKGRRSNGMTTVKMFIGTV